MTVWMIRRPEPVFSGVHRNSPGLHGSIAEVNRFAFDTGEVYGLLQGLDGAIITGRS